MKYFIFIFVLLVQMIHFYSAAQANVMCSFLMKRLDPQGNGWDLDPSVEKKAQTIFSSQSLTDKQKLEALFDLMVDAKFARLSPANQKKYISMVQELKDSHHFNVLITGKEHQKIIEAQRLKVGARSYPLGAYYLPKYDSIYYYPGHQQDTMVIQDILTKYHEYLHGLDYRIHPVITKVEKLTQSIARVNLGPDFLSPLLLYRLERVTVGSQWEILQMIPQQQRIRYFSLYLRGFLNHIGAPEKEVQKIQNRLAKLEGIKVESFVDEGHALWVEVKKVMRIMEFRDHYAIDAHTEGFSDTTVHSILNSFKSKKDFLKGQMKVHNYDYHSNFVRLNRPNLYKGLMFVGAISQLLYWASQKDDDFYVSDFLRFQILPIDVFFFLHILDHFGFAENIEE